MRHVTVQFGPTSAAQFELERVLARTMDRLSCAGILRGGRVEPVFPGDESDEYKGTFVVTFEGSPGPVAAAFGELPGVQEAYVAPVRAVEFRAV